MIISYHYRTYWTSCCGTPCNLSSHPHPCPSPRRGTAQENVKTRHKLHKFSIFTELVILLDLVILVNKHWCWYTDDYAHPSQTGSSVSRFWIFIFSEFTSTSPLAISSPMFSITYVNSLLVMKPSPFWKWWKQVWNLKVNFSLYLNTSKTTHHVKRSHNFC